MRIGAPLPPVILDIKIPSLFEIPVFIAHKPDSKSEKEQEIKKENDEESKTNFSSQNQISVAFNYTCTSS